MKKVLFIFIALISMLAMTSYATLVFLWCRGYFFRKIKKIKNVDMSWRKNDYICGCKCF